MFLRFLVTLVAASLWLGGNALAQADKIRKDRILVKFKPGEAPAGDERAFGKVLRRFPALGIEVIQLTGTASVEEALAAYKADARVIYAQPDNIRMKQIVPNDPGTPEGDAWHLENDGRELGKVHADISARAAWDLQHDAENVVVAVLDTGIRYTHEDLVQNMWTNTAEVNGQPGIDDDNNGIIDDIYGANLINNTGAPMDDEGHGTFVAGLIGAAGNNSKGVTGVCWRVKLMAVKVLGSNGSGTDSDIIAGMEYARQQGAKIINASLGRIASRSDAVEDAIRALGADGVILVAAAGNNTADNDFDADVSTYPATSAQWNVVSVAATTRNDLLATFSNHGWKSVDLGAPGVQVPSTSSESDTSYDVESGTSMAAPIVSGALALMTARLPDLSPMERVRRLLRSVDPVPALAGECLSGGRLNLARALEGGSATPGNDAFARAIPIGNDIRFVGSGVTTSASMEAGEPPAPNIGNERKSLWFTWTAPYTGRVKVVPSFTLTPGNERPAVITVFRGAGSFAQLVQVGTNMSSDVTSGPFFFEAQFGQTYSISLQNSRDDDGGAAGFFGIYDLAPDGFGDFTVLSVDSYGAGTVTPAKLLGETIQRRGRRVTLKATPAKGYILYAWVDPTVDDPEEGLLSREPVFTIDLEDKGFTAVQALFVTNPFRDLKGRYNGLATLDNSPAAFFNLDLAESGAFTATIRIGKTTYRFKGILRSDRKFQVTIPRKGGSPLNVDLKLNSERRITGTIASAEGEYDLLAEAGDFSITKPALSAGAYTIQLPTVNPVSGQPGGTGYGLLTVSPTGNLRFSGVLGDGKKASQGANLYRTGYWPFYIAPYAKGGALAGLANFDESQPTSDWSGGLTWTKLPSSKDATYPNGFTSVPVNLTGSRYSIPSSSSLIITVPAGPNNLAIALDGAGLAFTNFITTITSPANVAASNVLNMIVFTSTGEFAANFVADERIRSFHGMFSQKANRGEGYFIRGQETGKVLITPAQ